MKRISIIIPIILLLFLPKLQAQTTKLSGKILEPDSYEVTLSYFENPLAVEPTVKTASLNGDNAYTFEFVLEKPNQVTLGYGKDEVTLFLEPRDDLRLDFNGKFIKYSSKFSGRGAVNNEFLIRFDNEFGKYNDNYLLYEIAQRPAQSYRSYMDGLHTQMKSFLSTYSHNGGLSSSFKTYFVNHVDYWWAYNLLRYRYEHPIANERRAPEVQPKSYYTFLNAVPVQNEKAIGLPYYNKFIDAYLLYRQELGEDAVKKYTVIVESNSLSLRDEPKSGKRLVTVPKGTTLQYLRERSKVRSTIYTRGEKYNKPWIKVRTPAGQEGWVFEGGIEFESSRDKSPIGGITSSSKYFNASKHLQGDVLEYYFARKVAFGVIRPSENDLKVFAENSKNPIYQAAIAPKYEAILGTSLPSSEPTVNNGGSSPSMANETVEVFDDKTFDASFKYGNNKETKLEGKVENAFFPSVTLKFHEDIVSLENKEFELALNQNGEFNLIFDISQPKIMKLIYGEEETELYVEPGDDLSINFDGTQFLSTTKFRGKGAAHNSFLTAFNQEFKKFTDNFLHFEIAGRAGSDYKSYLNNLHRTKWNYYKTYSVSERSKFTAAFKNYLFAEIDYWWAFNLLRYRWENPAANGLQPPAKVNDDYYDFLTAIEINNDNAITSLNYLYFLGLYTKLQGENPSNNIKNKVSNLYFEVTTSAASLRENPQGKLISEIPKGARMKYLKNRSEEQTEAYIQGKKYKNYWYNVRLSDGTSGWIFGGTGKMIQLGIFSSKNNPAQNQYIKEEEVILKEVAYASVDKLRVRKSAYEPSAIEVLTEGEEVTLLGETSSQKFTFNLRGQDFNDYFYKVKTKSGKIGWIFGGGIRKENKEERRVVYKKAPQEATISTTGNNSRADYLGAFLKGRALNYILAREVYRQSLTLSSKEIKPEIDAFLAANPYQEYDDIIQEAYNNVLRREIYGDKEETTDLGILKSKNKPDTPLSPSKTIEDETPLEEETNILNEEEPALAEEPAITEENTLTNSENPEVEVVENNTDTKTNEDSVTEEKIEEKPNISPNLVAELLAITAPYREEEVLGNVEETFEPEPSDINTEEQPEVIVAESESFIIEVSIEGEDSVIEVEIIEDDAVGITEEAFLNTTLSEEMLTEEPIEDTPPEILEDTDFSEEIVADEPDTAPVEKEENPFKLDENTISELDKVGLNPEALKAKEKSDAAKKYMEQTTGTSKRLSPEDIDIEPINVPMYAANIKGNIRGHRGGKASLIIYANPVTYEEIDYNLHVKADGSFQTKIYLSQASYGKLFYNNKHLEVYIEPGDDLTVTFSANNPGDISFSGKGAVHNNFFKALRLKFFADDKDVNRKAERYNTAEFKRYITRVHKEKKELYQSYPNKNTFSANFDSFIKADIDYWYAYHTINYPWIFPMSKGMPAPLSITDESYYDIYDFIPVNNEGALPNEYFTYFLDIYLDDRGRESENFGYTRLELAEKYLQGKALWYYKTKLLSMYCRAGKAGEYLFELKLYMDNCPYPILKNVVKTSFRENRGLIRGDMAPDFILTDIDGKEMRLSDLRGKVVYIDFWATWCEQCIHKIMTAQNLKRKFKDDDLVFVYISLDNNENEWKNYVKRHHLTGIHVISSGMRSKTALDYGVKGLPTVFLVDKEGIIAHSPAKQPDQPGIVEQIQALLYPELYPNLNNYKRN